MTDTFNLMLAQLNPVVGDLAGNTARARAAWQRGRRLRIELSGVRAPTWSP